MWYSAFSVLLLATAVVAIWPIPVSFTKGSSVLWFSNDVQVTYNGATVRTLSYPGMFDTKQYLYEQYLPSNVAGNTSAVSDPLQVASIAEGAIKRTLQTISEQSIVPWKLHPRNTLASFEPDATASQKFIQCIEINQSSTGDTVKPLAGDVDESYSLTVTTDGLVTISAVSHFGVLYGLQSLTQLFYQHSCGCGVYTNLAPVSIQDKPKFSHRGLNFDVARNWYPVEDILRTIDAISWNKFNRLHLHMTDAQSWPLDIPALPELSAQGAYQKGLSYTPDNLTAIQEYAINRGIEVIIEFDMPGHTTAIGLSHPELIAAYDAQPWDTYCAEPPCGSLKLNEPKVDDFLNKLFGDVLPRVSPYSAYFHIGGDEVNKQAYLLDPTVNSNDTSVLQSYLQKFIDKNLARVRAAGLTPIVWEEMQSYWNLTLASDVVVQAWQTDDAVVAAVNQGLKAIGGNYNYWVCYSFPRLS